MQSVDCPFCDRANPKGAKFCNECGSPLYLAPCKQCGAVNHVNDTQCYRCGVRLTSLRAPAQAAHSEPGTEGLDQQPVGFEQQISWLEQELRRGGQEPRAIAQEPDVDEEERSPAGQEPGAIEHELGLPDSAPTASVQEPRGPVDREGGSLTREPRSFGQESAAEGQGLRNSAPAAGRLNIPEAKWLLSEMVEKPRNRRREFAAGALGVLLALAIAAGGYFHYRDQLSPGSPVLEGSESVTIAPPGESRTGAVGRTSVASMPPLAKDAPASAHPEPLPAAPPVKSSIARGIVEAPKPTSAPAAGAPAREADATTTPSEARAVAAGPAPASASDAAPESKCPPAVAAIALCDWITRADRK